MHGEIETVDRQCGLQPLKEFSLEALISRARQGTAGNCAGMQQREVLDTLGIEEIEIFMRQQVRTTQHAKILRLHQDRRRG